jgi:hypothetical protein
MPWLFAPEDVSDLADVGAAKDRKLRPRPLTDEEAWGIVQHLHQAFEWAMECDQKQKLSSEPERERRWYRGVARRARGLLEALDLNPDELNDSTKLLRPTCEALGINMFRVHLDGLGRGRLPLPEHLDRLSKVVWDEAGAQIEGAGVDENGHCRYRAQASFLVSRLPRTLALLAAVAAWQSEQYEKPARRQGDSPDRLSRELFKSLASAHEGIFGCKPSTRGKTGSADGGSINWVRVVIQLGANRIESTPKRLWKPSAEDCQRYADRWTTKTGPYVERFRELAKLSDRRISDLLDAGWREWRKEKARHAR